LDPETLCWFSTLQQLGGHADGMTDPQAAGLYRVRTLTHGDQVVDQAVSGPRFTCLEAARVYASSLVQHEHLSVIVEKLAPGGCWLQLVSLS
jgi:hypothetical protein